MALTGLQIFKLLPKTNCGECGIPTCMAFAMKLAAKNADLAACLQRVPRDRPTSSSRFPTRLRLPSTRSQSGRYRPCQRHHYLPSRHLCQSLHCCRLDLPSRHLCQSMHCYHLEGHRNPVVHRRRLGHRNWSHIQPATTRGIPTREVQAPLPCFAFVRSLIFSNRMVTSASLQATCQTPENQGRPRPCWRS